MALRLKLVIDGDADGAKKAASEAERTIDGLDARAKKAAGAGGAAASGAVKIVGETAKQSTQQLANLQFQLQDIAVSVASGQSFGRVLLQQGSQIVQGFGPGTGVLGALKATGAGVLAFVTNPLNLALLGFSAAAGAAELFFSAVGSGSASAGDALERHEDLIHRIRDAWPEATEGVRAYGREAGVVLEAQIRADMLGLAAKVREGAQGLLDAVTGVRERITAEGAIEQFLDIGPEFEPLRAAIDRLRATAAAGAPDVRAFLEEISGLAAANPSDAGLQLLVQRLRDLIKDAVDAQGGLSADDLAIRRLGAAASGQLESVKQFGAALKALQGISLPHLDDRTRALAEYQKALGNAASPGERAGAEAEYLATLDRVAAAERAVAAEEAKRRATGAANDATADARRRADQIAGIIAGLDEETAQLGRTGREQAIYNELSRAGVGIDTAAGAAIAGKAGQLYDLKQSIANVASGLDEVRDAGKTAWDTVTDGILGAKSAADILRSTILALSRQALSGVGNRLLGTLLGGQGTADPGLLGRFVAPLVGVQTGHTGAVIGGAGGAMRLVDPRVFMSAPRMHGGGVLGSNERPFIGLDGEVVGFPDQMRRQFGGGSVTFNISTPSPRAFAESRATVARAAAKLLGRAGRYS